jgi:hypothetical protein
MYAVNGWNDSVFFHSARTSGGGEASLACIAGGVADIRSDADLVAPVFGDVVDHVATRARLDGRSPFGLTLNQRSISTGAWVSRPLASELLSAS